MIWEEIRRVSPNLRRPGIQVVRVPFPVVPTVASSAAEGYRLGLACGETVDAWTRLLPRNSLGQTDFSWVGPPFEEFAVISSHDEDGCIFVTSYTQAEVELKRTKAGLDLGGTYWDSGSSWSFQVDVLIRGKKSPFNLVSCDLVAIFPDGSSAVPSNHADMTRRALAGRAVELGVGTARLLDEVGEDDAGLSSHDGMTQAATYAALGTMALLSCKNVALERATASRQQRRQAERAGLPLVSWHELVIKSSSVRRDHVNAQDHGESLALHWVRGHFKDYREHGLFGQAKGIYWWSPHLAGKADRVVFKDYVIPGQP